MSCSCSTLKPGEIIEAFNEATKTWQICTISRINTTQSTPSNVDTHNNQDCNTTLSLSVVNTPSTIPPLSCHDFEQKWRFISPSKLAKAPNINEQITRQKLQTNMDNSYMDDISSEHDDDDEQRDPNYLIDDHNDSTASSQSHITTNNRKRKFTQFATDSDDQNINVNTDNKEQKDTEEKDTNDSNQAVIDVISESDARDVDESEVVRRVSKRRRLNNSQHTFNNDSNHNSKAKSYLTKEIAKKKKRSLYRYVVPSENEDNNNNNNNNKKQRKRLELSSLIPNNYNNLIRNNAILPINKKALIKTLIKKAPISPVKPRPPNKKVSKQNDDSTSFDVLDTFRKDNGDKFPSLEHIETLCNVRRFDAKKLALRYFECRDSDRDYILTETDEYRCTKCNQMYNNDGLGVDSLTKIKTHVILHTSNAFKCPVCWKPFVNEHHLLYHIRQKKDATNSHKKYYQEHYAHIQNVKPKRRKKKKQIKETMITPKRATVYPSSFNLPTLSYHDYNVIKKKNMNNSGSVFAMNGPPPLSPVRNDGDIDVEKENVILSQQKIETLPPTATSSNNDNALPLSTYDIASLPLSTTVPGQELMSFRILDVHQKERHYPSVPIAPN